ncbi:hypothetical protein QYM36_008074 [Artemia franciscana]|uniref:Alkyl transferase n=1 Tax=Artemia franciscana TaxID=6661 RepID=A0AA88IVQ1_ARTSF|nr:hypothetical protein QYM36_008074 [Artemia franciscana]
MPVRSTIENIFSIRQIIEKANELHQQAFTVYVNFKAAFDSDDKDSPRNILSNTSLPSKFVRLLRAMHQETETCVQVNGRCSKFFSDLRNLKVEIWTQFDTLSRTLDWCRHIGIKEVTVYTFSIENFKRSKEEVNELMALAKNKFEELLKEKERVKENGIRIKVIGNISLLPEDLQRLIARVHLMTAGNDRAILNIAMAYTSKEEMTHAMEEIFWGTREDLLVPSDVDDDLINQCLYTWESNHPDLLIRTSGEVRLSDFMLWQTAYSCLHFSSVLWPEYSFWELTKAILHYQVVHPTIQLSSDKIPTFEEFALVEKIAVTGALPDEEIVECLTINEDAPSDDKSEEEEPAEIASKEAKALVLASIEKMDTRVANIFKQ